ncbi:MAG: hypothetical protein HY898_05425 [Deltaproteobacteria bacterium]|nr:hypothetical protein [Deltaproteobacteria bacterium]
MKAARRWCIVLTFIIHALAAFPGCSSDSSAPAPAPRCDDGCTNNCLLPSCGDGIVQKGVASGGDASTPVGGEECDDANFNGAFAAGDFIYALGGQDGLPDVNNMSAEHSGAPPGLVNFQGFNPGLLTARVDLGAAIQSGYFYVLGGRTPGGVTKTIEYVLY